MPHLEQIGSISKEELIMRVRASGCKMLEKLNLDTMRRSQILAHLQECKCPSLKKISLESK
jgi:hypothetical protein